MTKLVRLFLTAMTFAAPLAAHSAPVTWRFYETGCVVVGVTGRCAPPELPLVIATLSLPDDTSSGSAIWAGVPASPVYTGDNFAFNYDNASTHNIPISQSLTNPVCAFQSLCSFDISWSEINDQLTSVAISVHGFTDDIGFPRAFGLTGGEIASDGIYAGCIVTQCVVTGFWRSDIAVPEPMSAVLLIAGILATWLASTFCQPRTHRPRNRPSRGALRGELVVTRRASRGFARTRAVPWLKLIKSKRLGQRLLWRREASCI